MKRTEIERREREIKRKQKKERVLERKQSSSEARTPAEAIDELFSKFFFDENDIYNQETDEEILFFLIDLKKDFAENHWEPIIRKAIRKTKIKNKELNFFKIKSILDQC